MAILEADIFARPWKYSVEANINSMGFNWSDRISVERASVMTYVWLAKSKRISRLDRRAMRPIPYPNSISRRFYLFISFSFLFCCCYCCCCCSCCCCFVFCVSFSLFCFGWPPVGSSDMSFIFLSKTNIIPFFCFVFALVSLSWFLSLYISVSHLIFSLDSVATR